MWRDKEKRGREEPGAVMGVIRKPDPPLAFKGNGISRIDQRRNIARLRSI